MLIQIVRPAGIEPTSTVPKTGTLSVELRALKLLLIISIQYFVFLTKTIN